MTQTVGIRSEFQSIEGSAFSASPAGSSPSATTRPVPRLDAVRGAGVHVAERARSRALDPLLADVVVRHDERDAGVDRVLDGPAAAREREEREEGEPPHLAGVQRVELLVEHRGVDATGPSPEDLPARPHEDDDRSLPRGVVQPHVLRRDGDRSRPSRSSSA